MAETSLTRRKPPLIAIMTWSPDTHNGRNDAVRRTWVEEWCASYWPRPVPDPHYIFYYDREHTYPLRKDEIVLDAPRGLLNTSFKTKKMVEWALDKGYDNVFFVPVDCYVCVPRLLVSGFELCDYTGFAVPDEVHVGGGSGYWLSRPAMEAVSRANAYPDYEDRWVGTALHAAGRFPRAHDPRYWSWEQPWLRGIISAHLSTPEKADYDPKMMYAYHKQYLERREILPIPPVQEC